jgi:hypothetical protein
MKKTILEDVKIICDPPSLRYFHDRSMEGIAKYYEEWIKDFHDFIRDHRSQDPVYLSVEREYKDICSHCEYEWDADENGMPLCCDEAQKEWEEEQRLKRESA